MTKKGNKCPPWWPKNLISAHLEQVPTLMTKKLIIAHLEQVPTLMTKKVNKGVVTKYV